MKTRLDESNLNIRTHAGPVGQGPDFNPNFYKNIQTMVAKNYFIINFSNILTKNSVQLSSNYTEDGRYDRTASPKALKMSMESIKLHSNSLLL